MEIRIDIIYSIDSNFYLLYFSIARNWKNYNLLWCDLLTYDNQAIIVKVTFKGDYRWN